jgi:hypothetical protein
MERSAFTSAAETAVVLSGISTAFAELSQIRRWVTHALLTRAPLYSPKQARDFSYDLHVLGTPPAFILSQDQTRHLKSKTKKSWFVKQLLIRPTRFTRYLVFKDQKTLTVFIL